MNRETLNPLGSERGLALLAVMMIMSALTILSVGFMIFSTTEIQIADNQKDHVGALYTAEAGVSEIVARMEMDGGTNVTVNGFTFDASIGDDDINPDPNWRTEMYLQAADALPAPDGAEIVVPTVQPSASWLHYGDTGEGLEPIVVEHKWVDRNDDGLRTINEIVKYDANRFPPENFASGFPVEVIRVPAQLNGSQRIIRAEVSRIPVIVKSTAAITSDFMVDLTGNLAGCGHNHDIDTPVGTKIPGCRAWELCTNRTLDALRGCLVAVMTTGDDALTAGSSDLDGFPAWSDTSSSNVFYDIEDYLGLTTATWSQIRDNPDYTSANDAVNMDGTVIINGDATSGEKFNGNNGTGLIYVDGDMEIAGNFVWKGLIYVEGNCVITGTAWILGAIAVRGTAEPAFAAGNSTVLFSREAIAKYVGRGFDYVTLAWNEL